MTEGGDEIDVEVEELTRLETAQELDRPFYAEADETDERYKNKHEFATLHLEEGEKPTLAQLVDTCERERQSEFVLFEQGMWVEYRSNDMKWKVGRVNRVIKQPPDDWDFDEEGTDPPESRLEISYNVGVEGVVSEDNIRAPALGLQAIFGQRPWLWQQFTLLQLEKRLRFDQYHEDDFQEIDNLKFATTRYELWLEAPKNRDFKELHDSMPTITQKLLRSHLMVPFDLMDFIVERKDEWNFNDPDISVYTYTGVLGSGILTAFVTLTVQILTPLVLFYNNLLQSDGQPSPRFIVNAKGGGLPENGNFFPATNFEQFCKAGQGFDIEGRLEGKILIVLVLLIYAATVVPDSFLSFYRTSGGYKSTYSKINSLRNIVWEQGDDDVSQELGYKIDRLMNTGYISLLYLMMIFVLLNTPIILDIILNALAIDFIHQIDENIADADWWDEDNRWIAAGTIELVIQGALQLRILESGSAICNKYGIKKEKYKQALGNMKGLRNPTVAARDSKDARYLTDREVIFETVAREAEQAKDSFVLNEYRKKAVQFGVGDFVFTFLGRKKGVFNRYINYRTWSKWEKILFLPAIPAGDSVFQSKRNSKKQNVVLGQTDFKEFMGHVFEVLLFQELWRTIKNSFSKGLYSRIPVKIILGFFEIFLYLVQIIFPFLIVFCLFIVPYCY